MKISLIIPVYNIEKYLRDCLDSAINQTWKDYEIIIVDDGSTDHSLDICKEYSLRDPKVKLIINKHSGLMAAWMKGIQVSEGEYVAFLDGDDWVDLDYLEQMIKVSKGADMVCCSYIREYRGYQVFPEKGIPAGRYDRIEIEEKIYPRLINNGRYLGRGIEPHRCAKLIRRSIIMNNLLWCDKKQIFGEDLNIFFPVVQDCQTIVIMGDGWRPYHYRQNYTSISRSYKPGMFSQIKRLYTKLLEINRSKGGYDFSSQIKEDSFCLFLEYVKNEAKQKKVIRSIENEIIKNYQEMCRDFKDILWRPLQLKSSDKILVYFLNKKSVIGINIWLYAYIIAKKMTGKKDWKYRKDWKKKKSKKVRVLMVGPDVSVKGGIKTVIMQYLSWNKWDKVIFSYVPVYVEKNFWKKIIFFVKGCLQIWVRVLFGKTDIVHLHVAERGSFYRKSIIMFGCKLAGVKTILHHHGAEFIEFYDQARGLKQKWIQRTIGEADLNLVLGEYQKSQMKKRFSKAIFCIFPNTLEISNTISYRTDARVILFAGRMEYRKGIYDLLCAIAACNDKLEEDVKVYLCGDGEVGRVRKVIKNFGLSERIVVKGWLDSEQIEELYNKSMMFVLPSYREGLPMALLEAMAHGLPCIAGKAGAIPEVIENGKNGILVEPGNVDDIACSIRYLCENPVIRKNIGKSGYYTVKKKYRLEDGIKELQRIWIDI